MDGKLIFSQRRGYAQDIQSHHCKSGKSEFTFCRVFFICSFIASFVYPQKLSEISRKVVFEAGAPSIQHYDYSVHLFRSTGDFSNLVQLMFIIYKNLFSANDIARCSFCLSCSAYMVEAVKRQGVLGYLNGMDRLSRCTSLHPEKYRINIEKECFEDTPDADPLIKKFKIIK